MKKEVLTLLGCSSSIALGLLDASPAQANALVPASPNREYIYVAPTAEGEPALAISTGSDSYNSLQPGDCGCSAPETLEADLSDPEGERAIAQFGCDCAGCRFMARQTGSESRLQ